jgi:methyltransferase (TIGR00027 family)
MEPSMETKAGSVSETAHWIAAWRAHETRRKDAIFKDPFAERLAGRWLNDPPKGVPSWPMVARTKLIDDLIESSVKEGVDRVLNLAAGLDTRPYRLDLPPSLQWIEADFPAMIALKERELAGEKPRCQLSRVAVDLEDQAAFEAFLDQALAGAKQALVLTEGLLVYLEEAQVVRFAKTLAARPQVHYWVIDIASPHILKRLQKRTAARLDEEARMKFAPENGIAFYEALGWKTRDVQSMFRAAGKYRRLPFPFWLFKNAPDPDPRRPGNRPWGAVVRFTKSG